MLNRPFTTLIVLLAVAGLARVANAQTNNPPVVTNPGNKTANEFSTLTFTATATDPDAGQTLTWSLTLGIPAANGATINSSTGVFTWTPSGAQGNGTYPLTITATDNGSPPLSGSAAFTVTVGHIDSPPVIANPGNKTTNEQENLAFTVTATDSDQPPQTITWSLLLGSPPATGATIQASTGAFNWTPTEGQGPGVYPVTSRAESGTPPLSDNAAITITVNEVNTAPVLAPIGNKTGPIGSPITFTATATDSDVPANTLFFSLDAGAPSGATINATTGAFSWTPSTFGTFPVTVRVTDDGSPSMSDFEVIAIVTGQTGPPVLAAIGNKTTNELTPLTFTATATDPNPGAIFTFTLDAGAPAGASIGASTGAFIWTPTEAQGPGIFHITVRATNDASPPLSDAETITVTVNEVNTAPVLAPIGNKTACGPGSPFTFTATATDADIPANTRTFSLDPGAPSGATIGAASGVFNWTPSTGGSFPVTIRVTDNGSPPLDDFEVITITVSLGANQAPVLGAIGNKTVDELTPLTFTASATDAFTCGGDILTFSLDAGSPAGATINGSTGAFSWTPAEAQGPGSFPITVRVTDSGVPALSDIETITVTVNEVNQPPALAAIGNMTVAVGTTLTFTVTATDPDIPPNVLTCSLDPGAPVGATINGTTCTFSWTPSFAQMGVWAITVRVTDNGIPPLSDAKTINITVFGDGHPTADAGGPYTGVVDTPVNFDGTGSSDPAGQALTYAWSFGDGYTGTGVTPAHTYSAPGTYNVVLRVTDQSGNYDDATTTVTIVDEIPVTLLLKNGKSTISLRDNGVLKLGIEESEQPYASVVVSTVRLSTDFPNAGTVAECSADTKHTGVGDLDRNGVSDLELRFSMDCIRNLFRNVPNNTSVNLVLTGEFETSTGSVPFQGEKAVTVKTGGGGTAPVLAYPNPFNPQGRLSFETTRPGSASVQLFDLQGRLVRTLLPQQFLRAGAHEVTVDGLSDQGTRLSSGVYFFRVWTADGIMEGSINVLK